jgi:cytochrome c oxidase subunit 2
MGFPKGVSSVTDISLSLWQGAWIAAGVVGIFTLILILWPAVFHRAHASKGEFPKQTQYNIPVEISTPSFLLRLWQSSSTSPQ